MLIIIVKTMIKHPANVEVRVSNAIQGQGSCAGRTLLHWYQGFPDDPWKLDFFFFIFCVPSYVSGVHLLLLLLLLLLHSKLYLWGSPFFFIFFFFCVPSYVSGVHHSSSSSSSSAFQAISLVFTILLLILHSKLYLWDSPFWVRFLCM